MEDVCLDHALPSEDRLLERVRELTAKVQQAVTRCNELEVAARDVIQAYHVTVGTGGSLERLSEVLKRRL